MWQIDGEKETCGTKGGLVSRWKQSMKLVVTTNGKKISVEHISKVKYLGYSFYRYKGKCRFCVHPKSISKMKNKIKELTDRSNGWGNKYRALKLTQFIRG